MATDNGERERLINTIDRTAQEGLPLFEELARNRPDLKLDRWGAYEVLCHIVYFYEAAIQGWEAVRRGGPPFRYDVHVDELNARTVARLTGIGLPELVAEIRRLHKLYLEEARVAPNLDAVGVIRWDDSETTIRGRLQTNNRHWEEHIREWRELVQGTGATP